MASTQRLFTSPRRGEVGMCAPLRAHSGEGGRISGPWVQTCNPLTPTLSPRGRGSPGVARCTVMIQSHRNAL